MNRSPLLPDDYPAAIVSLYLKGCSSAQKHANLGFPFLSPELIRINREP
jgi:hypothetical protein